MGKKARTGAGRAGVRKIISGGQTGADRGGLDAAERLGIPRGGWCPKGRRAEDGVIPDRYPLRETRTSAYAERTELNVRWADATVVFTKGPPTGGSALTIELARRYRKPVLHVDLERVHREEAVRRVRAWVSRRGVSTLNVAGSREGHAAGMRREVEEILVEALGGKQAPGLTDSLQ